MLWGIQNQLRFFCTSNLGQQVPQHDVNGRIGKLNFPLIAHFRLPALPMRPPKHFSISYAINHFHQRSTRAKES
jgi:hypothetical protein